MSKNPTLDRRNFLWIAAAVIASLLPSAPSFPLWLNLLFLAVAGFSISLRLRNKSLPSALRYALTLGLAAIALSSVGMSVTQTAGAALLAAMLVTKLLETDTVRDGRSACTFALFSVMAGFLYDQGPLTLLLALIACILIVATLARIARLELPTPDNVRSSTRHDLTSSAKLLALSLPFTLVVFFLFPRFPEPLWGTPAPDGRAASGLSNSMSPGDIVEMLIDDSPAMRVTFDKDTPKLNQMYWRGPVLTQFDGRRWSRWEGEVFSEPAPVSTTQALITYEVMLEPTTYRYLIGLDIPESIPDDARMGTERTVSSRRSPQQVRRYQMGSVTDYVFDANLSEQAKKRYLDFPKTINPRTQALIAEWKSVDDQPQALIERTLSLFNREFTYTLTPPPLARDSVDDFIFNTRQGYCEHFASAFAFMMRSAGIPARVVTGYQGGRYNRIAEYWLIRNSDAHAWTEVWLEDRGWIRIDPTSSVAPERIINGLQSVTPPPSALNQFGQPLWDVLDAVRRGWNFAIVDFNAARQREFLRHLGLDTTDWRQMGLALAAAFVLTLGLSFWLIWRGARRRISDPLLAAWQDFTQTLARAGVPKSKEEGASSFAVRAAQRLPEDAETIGALTQRYIAARYAHSTPHSDSVRGTLIRELKRFRPRTIASKRSS